MCGGVAGIPEAPAAGQVAIAAAAVASIPWRRKDERHSRLERSPRPIHEFASSRAPGDHCSSGSDSSRQGEFVSSLENHRRGSKSRELAGAFPRRWAWRVLRSEGGQCGCRQRIARRLWKPINSLLLDCKLTSKKKKKNLPSTSSLIEPNESRRRLLERDPSGEEQLEIWGDSSRGE